VNYFVSIKLGKVAIGIYGAGSFGREVMAILLRQKILIQKQLSTKQIDLFFIDDLITTPTIMKIPVINFKKFLKLKHYELYFNVAIANTSIRTKLTSQMLESKISPISLIFSGSLILNNVQLQRGVIIMPNSIISNDVVIGAFTHINFNSYIAHNCIIGDFVTIAPAVTCCGFVNIGKQSFIGAGATIRPGTAEKYLIVGERSVLGMGSTLINDLPKSSVYVGTPARRLNKK
jgi:sugar O-acyltransferase (sialic acid O-acetyltransferase NeuD family)